jgi:hypothetical protein
MKGSPVGSSSMEGSPVGSSSMEGSPVGGGSMEGSPVGGGFVGGGHAGDYLFRHNHFRRQSTEIHRTDRFRELLQRFYTASAFSSP